MNIGRILIASLALCVLAPGATGLELKARAPWKTAAEGEFTVDYMGKGWPGLVGHAPETRDNVFYKLSWEGKSEDGIPHTFVLVDYKGEKSKNLYIHWSPTGTDQKYVHYFSGRSGVAPEILFSMNPGPGGKVSVKHVKLEEIAPSALAENLLPDGDFESGNTVPTGFSRIDGENGTPFRGMAIVPGPAFLSGTKSLELAPEAGEKFVVLSSYLPVVPGKKVELRFWAKAEQDIVLRVVINFAGRINKGGPHLYTDRRFKITEQWQEYILEFDVPGDTARYPSLLDGMARLHFDLDTPAHSNKVYFDHMEFLVKE